MTNNSTAKAESVSRFGSSVCSTDDPETFAIDLTDYCKTHEEWLCVVRFGLKQLLENQPLLIEIITRRACRMKEDDKLESRVPADYARQIFEELGLRFTSP